MNTPHAFWADVCPSQSRISGNDTFSVHTSHAQTHGGGMLYVAESDNKHQAFSKIDVDLARYYHPYAK